MKNANINPTPPNVEGLTWRPLLRNDLAPLVELSRACLQADGGIPFLFEPDIIQERYFPNESGEAIGAFTPTGRLATCAAVHLGGGSNAPKAVIVGQVHPDMRSRGIGAFLMDWSLAKAQSLLSGAAASANGAGQPVLQVATESLTEPADRLYTAYGFNRVFEELVMQRDLHLPLPDRALPPGVTLTSWRPDLAEQFYQAYYAAFRERPGFPGFSAAEWIARLTGNDLVPEWTLLARAEDMPLGFVIGEIDLTSEPPRSHVGQVGVIPAWRRRGLASALLVETMRLMHKDGAVCAQLEVHTNNPGAILAYTRLGFVTNGRRARYERILE